MKRRAWRWRAALAAPLLASLALWLGATGVSAHSYFIQSDPPDGAILANAPARVVLIFSSAVTPDFTSVVLVEAAGKHYSASVVADQFHPTVVVAHLPEIPSGSYRLSFSTRDRVDLHETSGSIAFGVGVASAPPSPAPAPAPARASEFLLRWAGLIGFAVLCGGLLLALVVVPGLPESAKRPSTQSALFALALVGSGFQLAAGTALAALQAAGLGRGFGRSVLAVATTEYGGRWIASTLLSLVLAFFLAALRRQASRGGVAGIAFEFRSLGLWALLTSQARVILLVLVQAAVTSVSGHAARAAGLTPSEVLIRGLHLLAMGVWAGGVVALLYAWGLIRRADEGSGISFRRLMVRFAPFAAISVATLGLTGLLLAGAQVASLTALLSTSYGAVLITKVVAIGVVSAIALRHVLPAWLPVDAGWRTRRSGMPPTLVLEGAGAVAVVLLAAVLSSSAPARGLQFEPPAATSATLMTRQSGGLVASVSIKPNQAGPNLISVRVVDERRPSLAPIDGVLVLLKRPGAAGTEMFATTRTGSLFDAGAVRLANGDVALGVVIRRRGVADTTIDMPWRVNPAAVEPAPVIISSAPLEPFVNLFVTLVVAMSLLGVVAVLIRHRWHPGGRGVEEVMAIDQASR